MCCFPRLAGVTACCLMLFLGLTSDTCHSHTKHIHTSCHTELLPCPADGGHAACAEQVWCDGGVPHGAHQPEARGGAAGAERHPLGAQQQQLTQGRVSAWRGLGVFFLVSLECVLLTAWSHSVAQLPRTPGPDCQGSTLRAAVTTCHTQALSWGADALRCAGASIICRFSCCCAHSLCEPLPTLLLLVSLRDLQLPAANQ